MSNDSITTEQPGKPGPKTAAAKQRIHMNAYKHGLTAQKMMKLPDEHDAYTRLTQNLMTDLQPANELERQLVIKIVDCHTRLNRIAAIENNLFNVGTLHQIRTEALHDDDVEGIYAQTRAWATQEGSFDRLGRYEARISRQLLLYTKELERLQALRRELAKSVPAAVNAVFPVDSAPGDLFRTEPQHYIMQTGSAVDPGGK